MSSTIEPAYLRLPPGELRDRASRAVATLGDCRACPRECGVDRLADRWSACKTGRHAAVASWFPHLGEEDCLRGWNGSGTIFFGHCNLRCVFCQNFDISQGRRPGPATRAAHPDSLAAMMLELQRLGCHNINLVTPEHVGPQILEALAIAAERGLRLPIVYNTGAYDAAEMLALFDGVVDIYMPDFKLWSRVLSRRYLMAEDYPDVARAAIAAMHRQVGPLVIGADGLATRGLLVRHLVMPGCPEETRAILSWIATELGRETYVNVMDQYRPAGKVGAARFAEIDRPLEPAEYREALAMARDAGLWRIDGQAERPAAGPRTRPPGRPSGS
jgi:putative pyruvate formate lyase activating enzyme